jgi:hypothetical protein
MDVFNRALMSGNWDDFFTSVKNAIRLTEDFQTILNNFSTD